MTEPELDPAAVTEFWSWWTGIRDKLALAISVRDADSLFKQTRGHVAALHPRLRCSFMPGLTKTFALVIHGVDGYEDVARRVLAEAPADDDFWEYFDIQPSIADPTAATLRHGDLRIRLADMRAVLGGGASEHSVRVQLFHPVFPDLESGEPARICQTVMRWVLGPYPPTSYRVEQEPLPSRPAMSVDLLRLRSVLFDLDDLDRTLRAFWSSDD
jgi:hypothetical protein